ncbi:MAG: cation:proton antiporter [Geminicoccaceae bacterium]|nr:cation:proton antiporter [Geminicoccaceae bacterium]MCS7266691.1 cation:proton antiporter [Geminicoccaceae bacterium]MCX7631106.1 cation:proton antiporter [Geminicoccaceae bacterium]MDW8125549.1 cation:proton antiporter [Geminicoccaceae bacterium]MDW8342228.1 cation:proton antiporter [Geminicoccaceae bacterium]
MGHVAQLVFEVAGLLALVALLPRAAQALRLPAPVLLAALGIALALAASLWDPRADGAPDPLLDFVRGFRELPVTAELFLWVFLPLLLFETAIALDARALLEELGPVLVLAVLAVVVCTLLAGLAVHLVSGYGLAVCLLVAAIVATTDPSAVVAIFREVGAPQRLSLLVEGESLLNDAAAIALFTLFLGAVLGPGGFAVSSATAEFLAAFAAGGALGGVLGRLAGLFLGRLDRGGPAEVTISVALAYLSYAVSHAYLGASGVVATVAAGLVFGAAARSRLTEEEWRGLRAIWSQVGFWASSLVFVLAAAVVPRNLAEVGAREVVALAALLAGAFLARALVLFTVMPMVTRASGRSPLDRAYRLVILWGGLRGAVTLALALAVAETQGVAPEVQRFVSALATGFVLFTLLVQGPTLRPLIHALGLDRLGPVERLLHARVLELARSELRDRLSIAAIRHGLELGRIEAIAEALPPAAPAAEAGSIEAGGRDQLVAALATVTSREIELYVAELAEETVSRASGTTLVRRAGELLDALRLQGVHGYRHVARRQDEPDTATRAAAWVHVQLGVARPLARRLGGRLEVLLARRRVLEDLLGFARSRIRRLFGERVASVVEEVLEERLEGTERQLDALRLQFPEHYELAAGRYLARLALQLEARDYERLLAERLLSPELFRRLQTDLERRRRLLERTPALDLGLDPDRLIARIPLLAALPPERRAELRRALRPRLALPGERIVRRGERGDAVYFIASGAVEVDLDGEKVRLGTGEVFGEMALLLHQPRRADVVAMGYCRLLVLRREAFRRFLRRHPELLENLRRIARERLHRRAEAAYETGPKTGLAR